MSTNSITLITNNLLCGGTERVVSKLANYYISKGLKVNIITINKNDVFFGFNLNKDINVIEFDFFNYNDNVFGKFNRLTRVYIDLRNYFQEHKNDIYISFNTVPTVMSLLASRGMSIKLIGSERTNPIQNNEISVKWVILRRVLYKHLSKLIVQTREIKTYFSKIISQENIEVIPNSIDKSFFNFNEHKSKSYRQEVKFLYIGRLEKVKGVDILIKALYVLVQSSKSKRITLDIVGEGKLNEEIKDALSHCQINEWVNLHPFTSDVVGYLKKSDVVIIPSRCEGLSNVLLEAMACSKCIVTTKEGGGSMIKNNINGLLIEKLNGNSLAETMQFIVNNSNLIRPLGKEAYKSTLQLTNEIINKKWNKVIGLKL